MKPESKSNDELERLAARIADDEPVNWRTAASDNQSLLGLREM